MEQMEKMEAAVKTTAEDRKPDPAEYRRKIENLSREDLAFMDGYLFAKVTDRQKGA